MCRLQPSRVTSDCNATTAPFHYLLDISRPISQYETSDSDLIFNTVAYVRCVPESSSFNPAPLARLSFKINQSISQFSKINYKQKFVRDDILDSK